MQLELHNSTAMSWDIDNIVRIRFPSVGFEATAAHSSVAHSLRCDAASFLACDCVSPFTRNRGLGCAVPANCILVPLRRGNAAGEIGDHPLTLYKDIGNSRSTGRRYWDN